MAKDKIQKFSKKAFLQSSKIEFMRNKDILQVLLKEDVLYSEAEVKEILNTYLNKEV